jgi:hypothetical protein
MLTTGSRRLQPALVFTLPVFFKVYISQLSQIALAGIK